MNRWRGVTTREPIALVEIVLPGGTPLRFATRGTLFDGSWWDPLLVGEGSVSSSGAILSSDVTLATMSFRVANVTTSLGGGLSAGGWLGFADVIGAPVTLTLWDEALAQSDAETRFVGFVQTYRETAGVIVFRCMQDKSWNRSFTAARVNRKDHPQANEQVVGAAIPEVLGKIPGSPMRPPVLTPFGDEYRIRELITGGSHVGPAVVIDAGRGGAGATTTRARIAVAAHEVKQTGNISPLWGTSPFLEAPDGKLHSVDPVSSDIFNVPSTGAGFYLPDGAAVVYAPVTPVDIETTTNYAENPRAVLDSRNETTAARMDWTGLKRNLFARLTNLDNLGNATAVNAYVLYRGGTTLAGLEVWVANTKTGQSVSLGLLTPTSSFAVGWLGFTLSPLLFGGALPANRWEFGDCRFEIKFNASGAGIADIIACGLAVQYVPKRSVLDSLRVVKREPVLKHRRNLFGRVAGHYTVYEDHEYTENVTEVQSKFYANTFGRKDPAGGPYTGVAGAVIERIPDVLRYALENVCGVPPAEIETGVGVLGSFVDARALLKTFTEGDMVVGTVVADDTDANSILTMIASAGVSELILSEFDNRWQLVPWRIAPPLTYPRLITPSDLLDPDTTVAVEVTPDSDVLSSLRVAYGYDAATKTFLHETSVAADASVAGHYYRNLRDGLLKVTVNVNDKIDWTGLSSGAHTYTLNAGDYALDTLLSALKAAFNPVANSVAVGTTIVAGVNNKLMFQSVVSGPVVTATLNAGTYTMHGLAAEVQRVLNIAAPVRNFTVVWNPSTKRFSFTSSNVGAWRPLSHNDGAYAALGFDLTVFDAGTFQSVYQVEPGAVSISLSEEWNFLGLTGTSGQLGNKQSAFEVLGFDWVSDTTGIGAALKRHSGFTPKEDVERPLATADSKFGRKRAVTLEARAVYETQTARELRNRLAVLLRKSRGIIEFSSDVLVDLRRGDVFGFSADMTALKPYAVAGTSGLWDGQKFRVIETTQKFGASWHTEVIAVDMTD